MSRRKIFSLLSLAWMSTSAFAGVTLPTSGTVVAGSGNIAQSGNTMTVTQSSAQMAINWQSFSIGQGGTVNFVQPSASSVALNRVIGSDVSSIQGSLTANGQVFLINPNGILFSPTAQVNVGGLVASTQGISDADFMAGNYHFAGSSSNAIINQGNIVAADGGTIALVAARISNDGSLTAQGGNVLLGAGSDVLLDMGGPVKLQIKNDTLQTLIQNGGVIKADGGTIWLTSQAAQNLASSVINNTGIIEADKLATGEAGSVVLYAHDGDMQLGGTIQAAGGSVETSGRNFSVAPGAVVKAGSWLIDPVNVTIDATLAAALETALGSGSVTVSTAGSNTPDTSSGETSGNGNITVNSAIAWSANKLTLSADGDIAVNADLNASGTGSLAFEYGLSAVNAGNTHTYTVADGVKVLIPDAANFTWKKGSDGPVNNLIFDNGNLRFGDGTEAALTSDGQLQQPFYYNNSTDDPSGRCNSGSWCQLTFSNYPLDIAIGEGGSGTSSWNYNGEVLTTNDASYQNTYSSALSNKSVNIAGYKEGTGTIVASGDLTFTDGSQVAVSNTYTLDSGVSYVKTVTSLTNLSSTTALSNVRLWVGTRDDYVAGMDQNYKKKGNLTSNGFELLTSQDQQARALEVANSNTDSGTAILFYSTSAGADTVSDSCCYFSNSTNKNPRTSDIVTSQMDGSYALFIRLSDLAAGQSDSMTWYYAAAPISQIASVATSVAQSAGAAAPATPAPAKTDIPQTAAVTTAQASAANTAQATGTSSTIMQTPNALLASASVPSMSIGGANNGISFLGSSGGLTFVGVNTAGVGGNAAGSGGAGANGAGANGSSGSGRSGDSGSDASSGLPEVALDTRNAGLDPAGFMRVFVVNGGINLPGTADLARVGENNPTNQ